MTISPVGIPTVFVGSSSEGMDVARAIWRHLENDAKLTLWNDEFFRTGSTFIETLVNAAPHFDFAILILTPDDLVESRSDSSLGPRDNVIFELGLFMGRLGRERTFAVHQREGVRIPTDLSGLVQIVYDWPRESYIRALATPCDIIREHIRSHGVSRARAAGQIREVAAEQQRQAEDIKHQAQDISVIKLILNLVLPRVERWHLNGLAKDENTFLVRVTKDISKSFESELRHLISLGLVERQPNKHLSKFFQEEGEDRNLAEYLKITPNGREYIEIYHQFVATVPFER
jgi:hypothetical protein